MHNKSKLDEAKSLERWMGRSPSPHLGNDSFHISKDQWPWVSSANGRQESAKGKWDLSTGRNRQAEIIDKLLNFIMKDKNITDKQKLLEIISDKEGKRIYESQDSLIDGNLF